MPVRGPRWTHTPRSLCTAAAAPPAVMLGLPRAVGMQFGYSPLRMGELGSCSRDVKPTCVLKSSLERAAVTDQLLRKLLEQLLQIFAGFDFTVTASAFYVVY